MKNISHDSSLADMAQRDIFDISNGVRGVFSFDNPRLFQRLQRLEPLLVIRHMV